MSKLNVVVRSIDTSNLELATITGAAYPDDGYRTLGLEEIQQASKITSAVYERTYQLLTGSIVQNGYVAVKSSSGGFEALYGPCVFREGNSLIIYYGRENEPVKLNVEDGKPKGLDLPEGTEIEFSVSTHSVDGYDNVVLKVTTFNQHKKVLVTAIYPIRFSDYKNTREMGVEVLQNLFKRGLEDFVALVDRKPLGYSLKSKQLIPGIVYNVEGYDVKSGTSRKTGKPYTIYTLVVDGVSEDGSPHRYYTLSDDGDVIGEAEMAEKQPVQAPGNVKSTLSVEGLGGFDIISPDRPATLIVREKGRATLCLHPEVINELNNGEQDDLVF